MTQHITVRGRPWCDCHNMPSTYGISAQGGQYAEEMFTRQDELRNLAKGRGIFVICMNSQPSIEAAVAFLRENGIDAEVTDGTCPTLNRGLED